jgi:hypothetical protein
LYLCAELQQYMDKEIRKPTAHSMKRRSQAHDYSFMGVYHITINVARGLKQPLGRIGGQLCKPDGDSDAPHVDLSPVGRMVEEELRESIHRFYPMLEVQVYVVMPEHLHFLLVAHSDVVSQSGKLTHLGHVIAGFKYGCNKRYWAMMGRINLATESPGTLTTTAPGRLATTAPGTHATTAPETLGAERRQNDGSVLGDSVAKEKLPPLFEAGYCDIMPVDADQLATQRAYIHANPRSRLMRMTNQQWLHPQRHTIDTAVSLRALYGYLQRECPRQLTDEVFSTLVNRLLKVGDSVVCDSYGSKELLSRRLLPVVCHRKDASLFEQQKDCCLREAAAGAVLVSARISKGEQEIMDAVLLRGYPIIRIEDNGFPEIYHPSADRMDRCAAGQQLLIAPWSYQYRTREDSISVPFCKTMNCVAQAICKMRDDWWKTT